MIPLIFNFKNDHKETGNNQKTTQNNQKDTKKFHKKEVKDKQNYHKGT